MARDRIWIGPPDLHALDEVVEAYEAEWLAPFPASLRSFLTQWNGFEPSASYVIWGCMGQNRDAVSAYDEPACERAFTIGELGDSGYLFLLVDGTDDPPVYFFDYSDPPPVFRIADTFGAFMREWMRADLDLNRVVDRSRERLL